VIRFCEGYQFRAGQRKVWNVNGASNLDELEEIKRGLLSIFDELSDASIAKGGGAVNAKSISGKIGIEQLDEELKKRLSAVSVIQYQLPNQTVGPAVAQSEIPVFQKIVDDVVLGQNVFLVGGAGTGKTTLAQNVAAALGREYMTINCSQWTAPTEIIGGQTLDGYQEGKLIEAWKQGFILILDELPKIDPNTAGLFNDALAKSKIPESVIFNSRKEHFSKHPNFAVIATGNIWPNTESMAYGANNKQDLSLLDRFAGSVYAIEKNTELEIKVVGSELLWSWCSELRNAIETLKYESQISMRFMMTCRDTLLLEYTRIASAGKTGLRADEGKTLWDCFNSFLETNFTPVQQKTIKDRMAGIINLLERKEYRNGNTKTLLVRQFVKSGYLTSDKGLLGLGSVMRGYLVE
jgi:cobaltochelatase CobS